MRRSASRSQRRANKGGRKTRRAVTGGRKTRRVSKKGGRRSRRMRGGDGFGFYLPEPTGPGWGSL